MKSNKKELIKAEKKAKKEIEKKPKVHVEEVPRFVIGDPALYFTETSTFVESGIIVGIFVEPGNETKNYLYQIEYSFKNDEGKEIKGLCMPKSENVYNASIISKKDKNSFIKRFRKNNIERLDKDIKDYKDSVVMSEQNIQTQIKYKKDTARVINGLEKRKKEIVSS